MTVRVKFQLIGIQQTYYNKNSRRLTFEPLYDATIPEDMRFSSATPNGRFEMQVDNPTALAEFVLGESYYIDFTPAAFSS